MPEGRKRKGRESIGKGIFYFLARGVVCHDYDHSWKGENRFPQSESRQCPYKTVYMSNDPLGQWSKSNARKEWERKVMRKPLFLGCLLASCPTRERGPLRPASQNWDTMEENTCLYVENSYIFFVVSIMRRD